MKHRGRFVRHLRRRINRIQDEATRHVLNERVQADLLGGSGLHTTWTLAAGYLLADEIALLTEAQRIREALGEQPT